MKRNFAMSASALLIGSLHAFNAGTSILPDRVAQAAQARIEAETYPALVIGIFDGDKIEIHTFGKLENGQAPNGDTIFEIGSITKTFTAALIAQAVERDELSLDTPVSRLLPQFTLPIYEGRQITLGDLATQFSGLPRLPSNFKPRDPANPYADYDDTRLRSFLANFRLTRKPGEKYEYSNVGFGILGLALAERAHTSYATLLEQNIVRPIDMSMTGVTVTDSLRLNFASGHTEDGAYAKNWRYLALAGAGAIHTTANDMIKYLRAMAGERETPLRKAFDLTQMPRRELDTNNHIGLAWMTTHSPDGDIVWHPGMTGGYASFVGFIREKKRGVVVLANVSNSVDDLGMATLSVKFPINPTYKTISIDQKMIDDYLGDFLIRKNQILSITRLGDQLYAQATGQESFLIFPSAPDNFFAKKASIQISFHRDVHKVIDYMVLHSHGDHIARRILPGKISLRTGALKESKHQLEEYAGRYQFQYDELADVTVNGDQLHVEFNGQPKFSVYANAKDRFFYANIDAKLVFERDSSGHVAALVVEQDGQERRGLRVAPQAHVENWLISH